MTSHPVEVETLTQHGEVFVRDNHGNITYHGFPSNTYQSSYRSRGGSNSPGWPHTKTTNAYSHNYTECHRSNYDLSFSNSITGETADGSDVYFGGDPSSDGGIGLYYPGFDLDSIRNKIVNRLLSNTSQQKVNLAQFVAEREQTSRLIASTAKRIAQSVVNLRRGNVISAVQSLTGSGPKTRVGRSLGGIPEQWLALQYGWKPLLSDVYGSCEELASFATGVKPDVYTVKASAGTEYFAQYQSGGDGDWIPPVLWTGKGSVSGKGSLTTTIGSPTIAGLSAFGVVNPVQLAWELLPWSFVVDWFLPVGQFISNCSAEDGLAFQRGHISYKVDVKWTAKVAKTSYSNSFTGWHGRIGGADHRARVFSFSREALTGFPVPSWPSFKDPFSPTHVANALSLLATAFSGRTVR